MKLFEKMMDFRRVGRVHPIQRTEVYVEWGGRVLLDEKTRFCEKVSAVCF